MHALPCILQHSVAPVSVWCARSLHDVPNELHDHQAACADAITVMSHAMLSGAAPARHHGSEQVPARCVTAGSTLRMA